MENKHQQEDTIDLGKLVGIEKKKKKEVAAIIAGCTIAAAGISLVLPKQ